jgi:hypothetical protein
MVVDHIAKNYGKDSLGVSVNGIRNGQIDKEQEREIKMALQKEINKLIF